MPLSLSGAFALWVLICVPMGAGWPVASAVGNEPPLTGRTCQQPLCPLPGLLVCRSLGSPARRCTGSCRLISIVSRSVGFLKRARKTRVKSHLHFVLCVTVSWVLEFAHAQSTYLITTNTSHFMDSAACLLDLWFRFISRGPEVEKKPHISIRISPV